MSRQGRQGGNTSSSEVSPARKKRQAAERRREEKRWERMAAPVTVRNVEPTPREVPEGWMPTIGYV